MRRFVHAIRGIRCAVRTEANLWFHLAAAVAVFCLAGWLRISATDFAILTLTVGIVITAELFNTAVERVVDLASPEYHELAKRAKDIAAGAVLIAAFAAVAVGLLLFGPPLWDRFVGGS